MTADETQNAMLNVGGTQNAVQLANELGAGVFHRLLRRRWPAATRAVLHRGHVRRGPGAAHALPPGPSSSPRSSCARRSRAPGASTALRRSRLAHRRMDIDGLYYFFKVLQKLRTALPRRWSRSRVGQPRARRLRRRRDRPHRPRGGLRQVFGIVDPKGIQRRRGDEHVRPRRPRAARGHARRQEAHGHTCSASELMQILAWRAQVRARRPRDPRRDPPGRRLHGQVRRARHPAGARRDRHRVAAGLLRLQAGDYWERNSTRTCSRTACSRARPTAAPWSSPAPRAASAARRAEDRRGGRHPDPRRGLSRDKLEEVKEEIESRGGTAHVYTADLSDNDRIDAAVEQILSDHAAVDMLVNNAGRSIRRSVMLSLDRPRLRADDQAQLPRLGRSPTLLHMKERGFGHRQRLLDRRDEPAALLRLRGIQVRAGCVHARGLVRDDRR